MKTFSKTPAEVLDYGFDFSKWLGTDTIQASTWAIDAGLTVVSQGYDNTSTSVFVSGGTLIAKYALTNRITTAGGRTAERTFYMTVVDKKNG